jgi:hypothetical protein
MGTPDIEIRDLKLSDLYKFKNRMRAIDDRECMASSGVNALSGLVASFRASIYRKVVTLKGIPVLAFGLSVPTKAPRTGVVWLLGTDDTDKITRQLIYDTKEYIKEMLEIKPFIFNFVSAENVRSKKWLSYLGFTVEEKAFPFGKNKELFHYFHLAKGGDGV